MLASDKSNDNDAVTLLRAARIIRRDILKINYEFDGFLTDKQYVYPQSAISFMEIIFRGGCKLNTSSEDSNTIRSAASTITQLLTFNTVKHCRKESQFARHSINRETQIRRFLYILVS